MWQVFLGLAWGRPTQPIRPVSSGRRRDDLSQPNQAHEKHLEAQLAKPQARPLKRRRRRASAGLGAHRAGGRRIVRLPPNPSGSRDASVRRHQEARRTSLPGPPPPRPIRSSLTPILFSHPSPSRSEPSSRAPC